MRASWCFVMLIGCGGDDGAGPGCPDFARILGGTFARTAETLTWTLEVAAIPAELTFDQASVPAFVEEYTWGVTIDATGDGTEELEVAAKHFKVDGPERVITDVAASTQNDLWQIEGALSSIVGSANVSLVGNTFTFVVDADEDPGLAGVQPSSIFTYRAGYQISAGDRCEDPD